MKQTVTVFVFSLYWCIMCGNVDISIIIIMIKEKNQHDYIRYLSGLNVFSEYTRTNKSNKKKNKKRNRMKKAMKAIAAKTAVDNDKIARASWWRWIVEWRNMSKAHKCQKVFFLFFLLSDSSFQCLFAVRLSSFQFSVSFTRTHSKGMAFPIYNTALYLISPLKCILTLCFDIIFCVCLVLWCVVFCWRCLILYQMPVDTTFIRTLKTFVESSFQLYWLLFCC